MLNDNDTIVSHTNQQKRSISMGLMGYQPLPSIQRELRESKATQSDAVASPSRGTTLSPTRSHSKPPLHPPHTPSNLSQHQHTSSYYTPSGTSSSQVDMDRRGPVTKAYTSSRTNVTKPTNSSKLQHSVTESPSIWNRLLSWATPKRETREQETQSEEVDNNQTLTESDQHSPSKLSTILFQQHQVPSRMSPENPDLIDSLPTSPIRTKGYTNTIDSLSLTTPVESNTISTSHHESDLEKPVARMDRIGGLVSASSGVFSDDMTVQGDNEDVDLVAIEQELLPDDVFDRTITLDDVPVLDDDLLNTVPPSSVESELSLQAETRPLSSYTTDEEETEDLNNIKKPFSLSTSSSIDGLNQFQTNELKSSSSKGQDLHLEFDKLNMNGFKFTPTKPPSGNAPASHFHISSSVMSSSTTAALAEFDPLGSEPQDWMMTFESPSTKATSRGAGSTSLLSNSNTPRQNQVSLLDTIEPVATPTSIVRFSQRDMDAMKKELQETFEKEFEVAQMELQELESQKKDLLTENQKMKHTLAQWEQAVKQMIADKEKDQSNYEKEKLELVEQTNKVVEERDKLKKELDYMNLKYKQLRIDMSDVKEIEEKQREIVKKLEQDVEAANQKFDTLRQHAEAKLEEANVKIASVRSSHEKELAAMKSKMSRLEVQAQALDRNLKAKVQENQELSKICDGLVAQIEQMASE